MQKRYGLIGFPLSHSFSKRYFEEKFATEKLQNCVYENFEIENIPSFPKLISEEKNLVGLNVTIPHKQTVIKHLDELDETAKAVGAVNCIKISEGKTIGFNTDVIGFEKTFSPLVKPHHAKALILGNGGATKAVEFVLRKIGIQYLIVSRTPGINQLSYADINLFVMRDFKVIINCTPLGMFPNVDEAPAIPYDLLNWQHLCYDLIYNPEETLFLKKAKAKGATTQNGLGMLKAQAEAAWEIWNK